LQDYCGCKQIHVNEYQPLSVVVMRVVAAVVAANKYKNNMGLH